MEEFYLYRVLNGDRESTFKPHDYILLFEKITCKKYTKNEGQHFSFWWKCLHTRTVEWFYNT